MIRPCDACGGVCYDGYPCPSCDAYQRGQHAMRERAAAVLRDLEVKP